MRRYVEVERRASSGLVGSVPRYLAVLPCFPPGTAIYNDESLVPFVATIGVAQGIGGVFRLVADVERSPGPRKGFLAGAPIRFPSLDRLDSVPDSRTRIDRKGGAISSLALYWLVENRTRYGFRW